MKIHINAGRSILKITFFYILYILYFIFFYKKLVIRNLGFVWQKKETLGMDWGWPKKQPNRKKRKKWNNEAKNYLDF